MAVSSSSSGYGEDSFSMSSDSSEPSSPILKGQEKCKGLANEYFEASYERGYYRGTPRDRASCLYHPYKHPDSGSSPVHVSQDSIERESLFASFDQSIDPFHQFLTQEPTSKLPGIDDCKPESPLINRLESKEFMGKGKIPRLDFENGDSYEGECLDEKPHGWGKYTCVDGSSYEGNWKNGIALSNASHLGEDLFFNLLCRPGESLNSEPPEGYCLGIMADYLQKKGYDEIASALIEAYQIFILDGSFDNDEIDRIFRELTEDKTPKLFATGTFDHAMGLYLIPEYSSDSLLCEIFNTGDGLDFHKRHPVNPQKYQTMLRVKIPSASVTRDLIESFSYRFSSVDCLYNSIFDLGGEVLLSDSIPWQNAQTGNDCSLRWILAFCEAKMTEKEHNELISKLETDCRNANAQYRKYTRSTS